ncbi:MAG: SDR family oxidoreductase [Proteobacteria bacterium]|nr:SDR family oxidoreductase [Pseudomonadota bacterium]
MELAIQGKVALITGAGQGVGREIGRVLAAEGARVIINDLFEARARSVADEIGEAGGQAIGLQADVTDIEQVRAMAAAAVGRFGPIDIMINNAGVPAAFYDDENFGYQTFADSPIDKWKQVTDLNFYGCLNCCAAVLPGMIEKRGGRILSIISEAGRIGEAYLAVYSGAKAGILGFSKALAREVGRYCINVNCIAIGATAHEGTKATLDPEATVETDPMLPKRLKHYPIGRGLGRLGRPSDAAAAAAFLVSGRAPFITGQCLSVSGGFSMVS